MDYGHVSQSSSSSSSDFFTAGAGTNEVDQNTFESENNLDLTNNITSWNGAPGQAASNAAQTRNVGAGALAGNIVMPEIYPPNYENGSLQLAPGRPALGQIVDTEMPPMPAAYAQPTGNRGQTTASGITGADLSHETLFEGDQLSTDGLNLIDEEIRNFTKGGEGDIAQLYDEIAAIREQSLPSLGGH